MKILLAASTALVCVAALGAADASPVRQVGMGPSGMDANQEFLCNYGFKLYSFFDDYFGGWNLAATPITGKGAKVNEIIVAEGPSTGYAPAGFQVAIYSSRHGKPDKQLVSASATQPGCGRVKVPVSPIKLEYGRKYWIVQKALDGNSVSNPSASILWLYDKKHTHGALSQTVSSSSSYVYPGPWVPLKGGVPYARAVEDKALSEPSHIPQSQSQDAGDQSLSPVAAPARRDAHEGDIPRYPP